MTGLWPRGFLSLTAALPLRVVEVASKFIEDAGLYKTFTTALRAKEIPLWWLVPPSFRPLRGGTIKLRYAVSCL